MAKVDYRRLTPQGRESYEQILLHPMHAFGLTTTIQQSLLHLLWESEIVMVARRILIARLLMQGIPFQHIQWKLHTGMETIRAVDRWLEGMMPSYRNHHFSKNDGDDERYTADWYQKKFP